MAASNSAIPVLLSHSEHVLCSILERQGATFQIAAQTLVFFPQAHEEVPPLKIVRNGQHVKGQQYVAVKSSA
ncbi:hypothetical protein [Pseudomonas sp. PLMAX]|uniref:hypothetical protein n=1 Tax=Pseudomonas sp. PLMAX TaxID=2201998 RepID=UPI0038B92FEB